MPYVATLDGSLLEAVGLPPIEVDHVAVVKLFAEGPAAPEEEQVVPRIAAAPLLPPADSDAPQPTSETYEAQQCLWALGHRVPQLIDFDADPYWPKRAAGLSFFKVHLVLFLSPPHADLARAVDRAIRTFSRGDVVGFMHTLHDFDAPNAMFTRHGVNTVLDTPKLIVRDQRLAPDDRQIPYKGEISEEAIVAFLRSLTPPLVPEGETPPAPAKDEL
mmetsp:Transcript_33769/g.99290  ORF Transcript_33769/g.99290 Transcript_33769/m.99290 type:complete len:217 (+) Transcript_33769:1-651(+)